MKGVIKMAVKNGKYQEIKLTGAQAKALSDSWNDGVIPNKKKTPIKKSKSAANKKKAPTKSKK